MAYFPYQCVKCRRITELVFIMQAEEALGVMSKLVEMGVEEDFAWDFFDEVYDNSNCTGYYSELTCVVPFCKRCGKGKGIPVETRAELRGRCKEAIDAGEEHVEDIAVLHIWRHGLSDAINAWDYQQERLSTDTLPDLSQPRSGPVEGSGRMLSGLPKDVRRLVMPAVKDGWQPVRHGGGHIKFVKDDKQFVIASTPSDRRVIDNIRRDMRSVGAI